MRPIATRRVVAITALVLAGACREIASPPPYVPPPPGNQPAGRAVGLMEITITGIRSGSQPVATARAIAVGNASGARSSQPLSGAAARTSCTSCGRVLTPVADGDGTIQLEPLSTSTFTIGTRAGGGWRYLSATYRVRNAPLAGGTGYTHPRNNLTFIAVNQNSGTIAGTNISQLYRFDGSAANPAIAAQMIPTGMASLNTSAQLVSSGPDVLQLFTEEEVAAMGSLTGIASVLPYGFVARETPASSGPRILAADAAEDAFGGIVTFAYRYPLQSTAAADPFTISGRFLAVDDNETWITKSAEELVGGGNSAFLARLTALGVGASPRGLFSTVGGDPGSIVCRVRSAGTAGTPTAFAADLVTGSFAYFGLNGATFDRNGAFHVFSNFPFAHPDATNFIVNSYQTGRAFVNEPYAGAGTTDASTPGGHYRAGEEIEMTAVPGGQARPRDAFCPTNATSVRLPITGVPAAAEFSVTAFGGLPATRIVTGDVNGDGHLDLVTMVGGDVKISAGNGTGGFGAWSTVSTGVPAGGDAALRLGDVNGDGHLDIVAAVDNYLVRGINDGSGGLTWKQYPYPYANLSELQLADWNRDGALDAVAGVGGGLGVVAVISNGDSLRDFTAGPQVPAGGTEGGSSVTWTDLNGDGALDLVAATGDGQSIRYAFNNGIQFGGSTDITTGSYARVVRAADLQQDGFRDLVIGTDAGLSVAFGSPGGFGAPGSLVSGAVADLAVADLDGDHDLDVVAIVGPQVRIFINDGGSLGESPSGPILSGSVGAGDHIAVGDFNNDGSVDLAVTHGATSEVNVLLNANLFNVMSAQATTGTKVVITFDAPPDPTTSNTAANYSIPGLTVNAAVTAGATVTLTTTVQTEGASYTLNVSSSVIRASDARPIDNGSASFSGAPSLGLITIASGLTGALFATSPPGDLHNLFVVQQAGIIRRIKDDVLQTTPFLDVSGIIKTGSEQGLLGLAFHPAYASNGQFFIFYVAPNNDLTVARYNVSSDPDIADASSGTVLLSIAHPINDNHNGGMLAFGPDGYLYIGTGDGGATGDPPNNAQDLTTLLGKILRIDVDGGSPYAIPPSNPFVGHPPAAPEVWAYGLRNPWRFSFDHFTGALYIGDVGQDNWEEIDYAPAFDPGGHNYGWHTMEGTHCYTPSTGCVTTGLVLPIFEYANIPANGCSITGGYVYRSSQISWLHGRYLFSDFCSGRLGSFIVSGGVVTDFRDHSAEIGPLSQVTSFGQDEAGELYIISAGSVRRIVPH
jgi:glucose/arabinose dehydrogenase